MKKKITVIIALVLCLIVATGSSTAQAGTFLDWLFGPRSNPKSTIAKEYFTTDISSSKDTVEVTVDLKRSSKITNGRVAVTYDPAVMRLDYVYYSSYLGTVDVNTSYTNGSKKGVSAAWISSSAATSSLPVLTLVFKVKNAYNKQKVSVETDVLEAYKGDEALIYGDPVVSETTLKIKKSTSIWDIISPILPGFGWF